MNLFTSQIKKDDKNSEMMREVIHKGVAKESSPYWRKNIPVYGWTSMNYPGNLQPSLLEKYENQRKEQESKELNSPTNGGGSGSRHKKINATLKFITDCPDREERMRQRMLNRKY